MHGSVRQQRPGSWQIRLTDKDPVTGKYKQRSITVRGTKKKAESELTRVLREMDTGTYVEPTKATVADFLKRWLKDYVGTNIQKPKTRVFYATNVNRHLIPSIGAIPLAKLTPAKVQELYRVKLESGLSSTSVNAIHRTIHRALVCAVKWGMANRNVCDATEPPQKKRVAMKLWTVEECGCFLNVAKPHRYYPLFLTALYTGLRLGELLGLRWQDVDLAGERSPCSKR